MINRHKAAFFTDLDGTILHSGKGFDVNELEFLRKQENILLRTIVTGRSLYSARKVLDDDFPIDYLIFSSGAGIVKWKTKEIKHSRAFTKPQIKEVYYFLKTLNLDFCIHFPIPDNHKFYYVKNRGIPDFRRRIKVYSEFAEEHVEKKSYLRNSTQFLVILNHDEDMLLKIRETLPEYSIIRATSPLDGKSMWIEIFPPEVDKGTASAHLCDILEIDHSRTIALGNDFNDIAMLDWAEKSYVVDSAPDILRKKYNSVKTLNAVENSVLESGFSLD